MKKKLSLILTLVMFFTTIFIGIGDSSVEAATFTGHYDDVLVGTKNLNNTAKNSAKLGDVLLDPEVGWSRYDNSNSKIEYQGISWIQEQNANFNEPTYKATRSFSRSNQTAKSKFSLNFKK